jgi:Secretion system C-terminal sorting domain
MKKVYVLFCALLACTATNAQSITGGDMESWRTTSAGGISPASVQAPFNWFGGDSLVIGLGQTFGIALGILPSAWKPQVFQESTIKHGGNFSAKLITRKQDTLGKFPAILTNAKTKIPISLSPPGIGTITYSGGDPVSSTTKPLTVTAWVQYYPGKDSLGATGIDSGRLTVQALSHIGGIDSVIAIGIATIPPTSSWMQVTATLFYTDTVHVIDTIRVTFTSSRGIQNKDSSTLYVDDVEMTTGAYPDHTGVRSVSGNSVVKVYPNPAKGMIYFEGPVNAEMTCQLFSMNGQVVTAKALTGKDALDVSSLPQGLYFYAIYDKSGNTVQSGKVAVNK